jgi:hypothetical protein
VKVDYTPIICLINFVNKKLETEKTMTTFIIKTFEVVLEFVTGGVELLKAVLHGYAGFHEP